MNARPKYFDLRELVYPEIFTQRGEAAWELLDSICLVGLDWLRSKFGRITINSWSNGGALQYCGLRPWTGAAGTLYSQHKYGRAFDLHPLDVSTREMYNYLLANPLEVLPYFTTVEDLDKTPGWLHVDRRFNPPEFDGRLRIVQP